jgi:endonuclease/exonuclease/phosphatase family metal-dependent hydrolase
VRVLTWNVWGRFGPWRARQGAIRRVLAEQDADLVCLQELYGEEAAPDAHLRELAPPRHRHVAVTAGPYFGGRCVSNGLLSRWPIASHDQVLLPDGEGRPGPRTALVATIDVPHLGPVTVVVTHLHHRLDGSATRQRQARALAELVAARRGDPETAFPLILAGDLNATPDSDEVRLLTGRAAAVVPGLVLTDVWEVAGDGTQGHTWSAANPHVADSAWPGRRLDYVLVSWPRPRPLGNPRRAWLAGTEAVDGVQPSDHCALVVDLHDEIG